jgi:hypothetical protein
VYILKFGRCKRDDIATRPGIRKCIANVALRVSKGWFIEQAKADTSFFGGCFDLQI